eukprot:TRINITY_DN8597_c0_g1_i7.p1 TRINITY_DN8597_c0_g1~~TRINITY_DN8597_c0_g1_i7.p1  ORF type:complete len:107 (-),score=20.00 TRINITY_DN8597_c0_g1_i7:321-641(-)
MLLPRYADNNGFFFGLAFVHFLIMIFAFCFRLGKCRFSFDVWGPAVEEASNLQRICGVDQILVDEAVNRLLASDPHIETDPWVFDGHSCFFVSPPESETIQLFTNI